MNLIWVLSMFSTNISCPIPTPPLLPAFHWQLKACLFSYRSHQVGQRIIISTYTLGGQPQEDCSPPPGRYLVLSPSLSGTFSWWALKQQDYTRAAQSLGDVSWQGSLTLVVLGYLCILLLFKNAFAKGETIKLPVAELGLQKYTLPKVWFLSVSAARYPLCCRHLHLSDPGTSAPREGRP